MPTNYVLVDFENVQPENLAALAPDAFKVKVFVGATQAKGRISFELSHSMQMLGANAEYVRIARSGPNATDMHIAYYVGQLLADQPDAMIHIVSRDTDFDPLIEFLQAKGSSCRRVKSIAEIVRETPAPSKAPAPARPVAQSRPVAQPRPAASRQPKAVAAPAKKPPADRLESIVKQLRSLSGKPGTRKKLAQTIATYFKHHGGAQSEKVIEQAIDELIRHKLIAVDGTKVMYTLGA